MFISWVGNKWNSTISKQKPPQTRTLLVHLLPWWADCKQDRQAMTLSPELVTESIDSPPAVVYLPDAME